MGGAWISSGEVTTYVFGGTENGSMVPTGNSCGYKISLCTVLRCRNLQGGERFTILDLSEAVLQMELDEGSRKYLVVNTHRGLFRYKRLPFGVSYIGHRKGNRRTSQES